MNSRRNQKWIPKAALLLGVVGFALRLSLDRFFREESGLFPSAHPLSLGAMAVAIAALALAFYAARNMEDVTGYQESFPASLPGFLGHILAAAGILATVLTAQPGMTGRIALLWKLLGLASVPCLLAAGWLRQRGRQPFFLFHLIPTLFLLFHVISSYQNWSRESQMIDYLFSLLGIGGALLFAFYHSAFDAGLEWRRRLLFFAYAGASLSFAAIPGSPYPWLYLGCGFWALLDRPVAWVRRRRPNPFEEETP